MDGLELNSSKLTTCALELDNFTFSALELDHSRLKPFAQELDNSRCGVVELATAD